MGIIYVITLILIVLSFILLNKSETKLNIVKFITITILLSLCYNLFLCYVLSLFKIECNLVVLSILNTLITIIILIKIYRQKRIQQYDIKIKDIIFAIAFLIIIIIIFKLNYGFPIKIKYETTDSAFHYLAAIKFYQNSTLLSNVEPEGFFNYQTFMPASYVNTGLIMKVCSNFMPEIELYNIYIMFDAFMLYLTGLLFYSLIIDKIKKLSTFFVAATITVIFTIGYPLNSIISGFSYLNFGINVIIGILIMAPYLQERTFKFEYFLMIMFLLTFGLFFSYYFFVPVVYAALGVYMLIHMIGNSNKGNIFFIFRMKNIIAVFTVLIFPALLGVFYFIIPGLITNGKADISSIDVEGYVYRDLFSNFIMLFPFSVYWIIEKVKNKENNITSIIFIFTISFVIVLFILGINGHVSSYYFYKSYYLLWIIVLYTFFLAIYEICNIEKTKILGYIFVIIYVIMIIYVILGIDYIIIEKDYRFNTQAKMQYFTDIYEYNVCKLFENNGILSAQEIEVLKYYDSNVNPNKHFASVSGTELEKVWSYCLVNVSDCKELSDFRNIKEISIKYWLSIKTEYLIYFNNGKDLQVDLNNSNYEIVFKNDSGGILKRN